MNGFARVSTVVALSALFCVQSAAQTASPAPDPAPAVIPVGQKFIMQLETSLHTRTTHNGDPVEFTTAADVVVDNQVVIPNKSLVRGTVVKSKRAGLLFGRAEIHLRFDEVKLADGTELPLKASITRMGFDPVEAKSGEDPALKGEAGAGADAKTVASGSAQGAIIGLIYGGAKGGMYGAAAGAAVSVAQMALRRGPDLDLPRSTMFEARFENPMEVPAKALQAAQSPPPAPSPVDDTGVEDTQVAMRSSNDVPPDPAASDEEGTSQRPVLKRREGRSPDEAGASGPAAAETASAPPVTSAPPVPEAPPAEPAARAASKPLPPDPSVPTISRVSVRMVQVDAVVRDRSGRLIDNLTADDFRVYEDGVLQEIQSFSRDELPLAVALVVDRSGSVAPYISELRRIAGEALNQLKPKDEVCLFSFAQTVERLEDLTTNRRRIADALDRIRAGGGTDITDAIHDAVNYLALVAPGRRHAIILVSDNQQTVDPQASEYETIRKAMETETVVYSLKTSGESIPLAGQLPAILSGAGNVGKITQETGGEVINVNRASSLDNALEAVISRLRMRYSFGYYPSGTAQGGMFHEIKVRLTEKHGKAGSDYFMHAKRGYYATGQVSTTAQR